MAQQRLRRHQDQRLAEVALQLPAQDVEIVGRRRAVGDLHVVLGAQLQEALEPGRGMLRPLAFIAVRQQADEAGHAQPLALARRDELVEHHLRAVGEVAELRFPQRQRVRLGERIAIFEAEHRLFREHRVDDLVVGLRRRQIVERDVAGLVALVVEHRVALREGAALEILAGQADRVAVEQDRAEGQRLGRRPVDALARLDHLAARFEEARDRLVRLETGRHLGQLAADLLQRLDRHGGLAAALLVLVVGGAQARPGAVEPVGLVGLVVLADLELRFEMGAPVRLHLLEVGCGDQAFGDQLVAHRSARSSCGCGCCDT